MAVPTGTQKSYEAIGNREDLADVIYDISPTETPFMSNISRGSCSSKFTEWQTDSLDSATAGNKTLEGDDATTNTASPTIRLGNYCQLADKVARVSTSQEAITSAGRKSDLSYQMMKRSKELKRDIEKTLCGTQAADGGSAATARAAAGIAAFIWNNQVKKGSAATTVTVTSGAPTTAPTAGTAGTLTEANLKTAIQYCWEDGGDPNMVLVGAHNKQLISAFSGIATQYRDNPQAGPATIIGAADVYVSDFGTVNIVPSRFTANNNAYVLDTSTWEVCYLQSIQQRPLAVTGHSDRRMIFAEFTLKARSPEANAKVYSTTTS